MKIDNIALILGIVGSLLLAGVALYRARPQKQLDAVMRQKAEQEVKTAAETYDREKSIRIMRLENYATSDVRYHRLVERYDQKRTLYEEKLLALLERCIDEKLIRNGDLPEPPGEPPTPPDLPDLKI